MARNALISEKRFKQIEARQGKARWLAEYQPAMLATRDEAPKISRPSTLYWAKAGRDLHFMSGAERHVGVLALYHPRVFDIHEQHMLHPFEAPHPLATYNGASNLPLRPLRGTVAIAEQLGILSDHPVVWLTDQTGGSHEASRHAFPYLGDLLLFLTDDNGPYCVNWSVKACHEDFYARAVRPTNKTALFSAGHKSTLSARHRLEQQYFADAQIPTHFIAEEELDSDVINNLNSLCAKAQRPSLLPDEVEEQLIFKFQNLVGTQNTVLSLLPSLTAQFPLKRSDCLAAFYRAIWFRRLRLDLYKPVLVDKPLKPERSDVLLDYAHLFGR